MIKLLLFFIRFLVKLITLYNQSKSGPPVTNEPVDQLTPNPELEPESEVVEIEKVEPVVETKYRPKFEIIYLNDGQFVKEPPKVNQIYLHHTVGGTYQSTHNYWNNNLERVCTHFLIDRDGTIVQCIPWDGWGYHLYIAHENNKAPKKYKRKGSAYDKQSIGIELCNFGQLKPYGKNYKNVYNQTVRDSILQLDAPYKGYSVWESYTNDQLLSLEFLLLLMLEKFPILISGLKTDYSDIFDLNQRALDMKPGIFAHSSICTHKYDVYPHPGLIKMLNNLHTNL